MEIDKKAVGLRIKSIRISRGFNMEEFGKLVNNTSKGAVNNWEKGVNLPNAERLSIVARLGGITVNELLYGDITNYVYALAEDFKQSPPDKESRESLENMSEDQYQILISVLIERVKRKRFFYEDKDKIVAELQSLAVKHFWDFPSVSIGDYSLLGILNKELNELKEGLLLHEDEKEDYMRWIKLIEKFIAEVNALEEQK